MSSNTLTDFSVAMICVTIFGCLFLTLHFFQKMAKRKGAFTSPSSANLSKKPKIVYKNMNSSFCCGHVGCSVAPDPNIYNVRSKCKQFKKQHELSLINDHFACRIESCPRCIELFNMSATELLRVANYDLRKVCEIADQVDQKSSEPIQSQTTTVIKFIYSLHYVLSANSVLTF